MEKHELPISIRFGNTAGIDVLPSTAPAGLPDYKPIFGRPVELVRKAIAEITSTDEGKELPEITVDVMRGGRPKDSYWTSVYIELTQVTKILDPLPRPDLLTDWLNSLTKFRTRHGR